MRRTGWVLLVLFVFAIPWEYSLDVGAPFGNVARILGVLTLLAAAPAVLQEGRFRRVSAIHWLTIAFYLWQCCTFFWTVVPKETLFHLRAFVQEMMLVWLVWEFVDTVADLEILLRAWLAGSWILAALTIVGFISSAQLTPEQVRFAAIGQDPNDVARLLAFGFPIAGIAAEGASKRVQRMLCLAYFPVGFAAILLTASRSGLLLGLAALAGSGIAAFRWHSKALMIATCSVVLAAAGILVLAPMGTLYRLGTTTETREYGDLNQRVNIWSAGLSAFQSSPIIGHGAGSFVSASRVAPEDTAHNTALSILVEGGLCGLSLSIAIIALAARAIAKCEAPLRFGLSLLMFLWVISSLTGTLWENRTTWFLIGFAAASGRIAQVSENRTIDGDRSPVPNREEPGAPALA